MTRVKWAMDGEPVHVQVQVEALALIIAVFAYSVSNEARPQDVISYFTTAFIYSFCIGCLAHGLMPYLWA